MLLKSCHQRRACVHCCPLVHAAEVVSVPSLTCRMGHGKPCRCYVLHHIAQHLEGQLCQALLLSLSSLFHSLSLHSLTLSLSHTHSLSLSASANLSSKSLSSREANTFPKEAGAGKLLYPPWHETTHNPPLLHGGMA